MSGCGNEAKEGGTSSEMLGESTSEEKVSSGVLSESEGELEGPV